MTYLAVALLSSFTARTWRSYGYLWVLLFVAPFALAYALLVPSLLAGLAITLVGLFVAGWLVLAARGWGAMYRALARGILHDDTPAPPPVRAHGGFWATMGGNLGDATGWRALLFMFVSFPVAVLGFVLSTSLLVASFGAMTHWLWSWSLPAQRASDGTWHRGASLGPDWFVDTPVRHLLLALAGLLVFLFVWPWITRGFAGLVVLLTRGLLSPTAGSLRVAAAETARRATVEDAEARLSSIERNLHDGAQARLVSVAMKVGDARDMLLTGSSTEDVAEVLASAHSDAKGTITELRELTRGMRPPVLDSGLPTALETLASRSPLPVKLQTGGLEGVEVPTPVVTIVYFAVAELLTNAVKHAAATRIRIEADTRELDRRHRALTVDVFDDGVGGAALPTGARDRTHTGRAHTGTGLLGVADRLSGVEGTLSIDSPHGGPTHIRITVPMRA